MNHRLNHPITLFNSIVPSPLFPCFLHFHLGRSELFPQSLHYNNNGRFMLLCGDGEYSISTTRVLRSKCFGPALEAVWAADGNGDYAVKEVLPAGIAPP